MAYFNGWKKSKYVVVAILMLSLIATYALPMTVYADDLPKPVESDYENKAQSEIDPALTDKVDEAQDQEKIAEDAAKKAADQAAKAAEELKKAQDAADAAAGIGDGAQDGAQDAEDLYDEGSQFVDDAETDIEDDIDVAKDAIEDKAEVASDAADEAAKAAKDAEDARIAAQAATDAATAEAAAKEAADAAKIAADKSSEAETAYQDAQKILDDAKKAYDDAVLAANTKIDGYNDEIDEYQNTINNLKLATLRAEYDAAEKATMDASDAAKLAADEAQKAADASELAANAAINYYVNPAQVAYDKSLKDQEAANAAKLAAEQAIKDQEAVAAAKAAAYNAIIGSTSATAKAAQDAIVAQKKIEMDAAAKAYSDLSKAKRKWQKFWNTGEYRAWKDAQNTYSKSQSDSAYNNAITAALNATPEHTALVAAQSAVAIAKVEAAKKAQELANAQKDSTEKQAALNSAIKTRDDYLSDIKAAVGDADTAKILEALEKAIDASEADVNETIYDEDLYGWASDVKDDTWWKIWHWDVYKDAKGTVDDINEEYTKDQFTEWLDKTFPWVHKVKNTDEIIAMAEEAYRQELKLHEEELAFNEAYIAEMHAVKAAEAAKKQAEAAELAVKLAEAKEKLAQAESDLADAKERVNALDELKYVDTTVADAALKAAEKLVAEAKQDAIDAKEDADQAAADAEIAQAEADELERLAQTHSSRRNNRTITVAEEVVPEAPVTETAITVTETAIAPVETVAVLDDAIPAGPLPKTGGVPALLLYGLGTLLAGGGFALKRKENK